jgi:methylmalonyl-CoA/ethylmalonyl-CoA epimerase
MAPASRMHHIGFVVEQIAQSMEGFVRGLSGVWDGKVFADPHQGVKVAFVSTPLGLPQIELVEPDGEHSPVRKFLNEKGGGLHHVCYEVSGLEREIVEMRARGALLVRRPTPAVAFEGRRVAWVLTQEKLLMELLESCAPPREFL